MMVLVIGIGLLGFVLVLVGVMGWARDRSRARSALFYQEARKRDVLNEVSAKRRRAEQQMFRMATQRMFK